IDDFSLDLLAAAVFRNQGRHVLGQHLPFHGAIDANGEAALRREGNGRVRSSTRLGSMKRGLKNTDLDLDYLELLGVDVVNPRLQYLRQIAFLVGSFLGKESLAFGAKQPAHDADEPRCDFSRRHQVDLIAVLVDTVSPRWQDMALNPLLAFVSQLVVPR